MTIPMLPHSPWSAVASLSKVRARIDSACQRAGRDSSNIQLVAVSKFHPIEKIKEFMKLGQTHFAENYFQELQSKSQQLQAAGDSPHWHFTGRLQSNKLGKIAALSDTVQTLYKMEHAEIMDSALRRSDPAKKINVFIQLNLEAETQKAGLNLEEARILKSFIISKCPHLRLLGIMAIPSYETSKGASLESVPPLYFQLRKLADEFGEKKLSLGMSSDLEAAVMAGSDILRIGEALFGPRPTST
jgi:PLP dependent protein